jgi:hypothetical protein
MIRGEEALGPSSALAPSMVAIFLLLSSRSPTRNVLSVRLLGWSLED